MSVSRLGERVIIRVTSAVDEGNPKLLEEERRDRAGFQTLRFSKLVEKELSKIRYLRHGAILSLQHLLNVLFVNLLLRRPLLVPRSTRNRHVPITSNLSLSLRSIISLVSLRRDTNNLETGDLSKKDSINRVGKVIGNREEEEPRRLIERLE